MNTDPNRPVQQGSLARLIRFLIELAQDRAFAKVELTIQAGRISVIHVDRAYRMDELPVRGEKDQATT